MKTINIFVIDIDALPQHVQKERKKEKEQVQKHIMCKNPIEIM